MEKYTPIFRHNPILANKIPSAWGDIPTIIKDIMIRFNIKGKKAIEFGVEYGYSTSAIANYFDKVVGVDTFMGDVHAGIKGDHFETTKNNLSSFENITLVQQSYQDFIESHDERYNLAHVDIVHTYQDTYLCGEWCINHSDIVVFHDTISFKQVCSAVEDLSEQYNMKFYNYTESHGLGILVPKTNLGVIS
jgi:predicted O-methyltransferase YrrM